VPWIYGEDASDVLRDCVNRKLSLLPYLLQTALEAHNSGTPVMRASFVEFPKDKNTYSVDTQFFLGSNLLVAPVFSESGEVSFYVPEGDGEWVSWFDKTKRYAGGRWYTETHDFFSLPLLVRPGTVTLVNPALRDSVSDYRDGLQVLINGNINEATEVPLVDVENPGQTTGIVRVTPRGKDLIIDGPGAGKNWSVTYLGKGKCNSEGGTTTEGSGFVAHTTPATSVVLSLE
jgi:alpha-D-xyloside xylohydrolase